MTRWGFSLLELLVILAVLGILMGLGTPSYLTWRANAVVTEATQQFARDIDQQRTQAKRTNAPRSIRVASSSTYELNGRTVSLPAGVSFASASPTVIIFLPPYGTKDTAVDTYRLVSASRPSIGRTIRVVGVTGKVVIKHD